MNFQEKQKEFMQAAQQPIGRLSKALQRDQPSENSQLYYRLINEESSELEGAYYSYEDATLEDEKLDAICDCAKELADLIYVICGFANSLGIPLAEVYEEVHRSNMTKFTIVGNRLELVQRADGKVLKPTTYKEANIRHIIQNAIIKELTPKTVAELEEIANESLGNS